MSNNLTRRNRMPFGMRKHNLVSIDILVRTTYVCDVVLKVERDSAQLELMQNVADVMDII